LYYLGVFDYSRDMPRVAPAVLLNQTTKAALEQLVRSPSTPQSLVQRGRIVLAAATGQTNQQIAGALAIPEVTVGKWRRGFARQGLEGLQDAPRSGRPVKHGPEIIQRVQQRASQKPRYCSRWSVRTLAADLGLPRSTVYQILVSPRSYSPIAFAPLPSVRIPILKPSCWTLSACI